MYSLSLFLLMLFGANNVNCNSWSVHVISTHNVFREMTPSHLLQSESSERIFIAISTPKQLNLWALQTRLSWEKGILYWKMKSQQHGVEFGWTTWSTTYRFPTNKTSKPYNEASSTIWTKHATTIFQRLLHTQSHIQPSANFQHR